MPSWVEHEKNNQEASFDYASIDMFFQKLTFVCVYSLGFRIISWLIFVSEKKPTVSHYMY